MQASSLFPLLDGIPRKLPSSLGADVLDTSLQSVADRDFVAEYLFACSLLMVHISRFAEDIIIYSSSEFNWVVCGDAYSCVSAVISRQLGPKRDMLTQGLRRTGSSIMPQKKNPDACELLRGKSGRTVGQLTGFLTTLKGLPATYNKDLQESQEPMFDAAETVGRSLRIVQGVISTLKVSGVVGPRVVKIATVGMLTQNRSLGLPGEHEEESDSGHARHRPGRVPGPPRRTSMPISA